MITESIVYLGKSNYGIAIISDILRHQYIDLSIATFSNIPDEENDSLDYACMYDGIKLREYNDDACTTLHGKGLIVTSIGKSRRKIYDYYKSKIDYTKNEFITVAHPSSVLCGGVSHGAGLHLSPLSVVAPYATLGHLVVINRNVSIGHHTYIGDFATINPGVNIAGMCNIGHDTVIGAGSVVIDKVKIGHHSVIGAGSVVTKDLPDYVVAYGNPCKIIRELPQV